jgi:hypothetical protein
MFRTRFITLIILLIGCSGGRSVPNCLGNSRIWSIRVETNGSSDNPHLQNSAFCKANPLDKRFEYSKSELSKAQ